MEIRQSIKEFIIDELVSAPGIGNLKDNQNLIDEGLIDSLGMVKLLGFMEDSFAIKIDDDELIPENFETLESISNLVNGKIKN